MNSIKRLVPCYCIQIGNEFVPFWELKYRESEQFGEHFYYDHSERFNDLIKCYYDLHTRKILLGKVKEVYPKETRYTKGELVLVEAKGLYNTMRETTVVDVLFEEYETRIISVKGLEDYELDSYFTEEEQKTLILDDVYEIRQYQPTYVFSDGYKTKWEHEIKHKA